MCPHKHTCGHQRRAHTVTKANCVSSDRRTPFGEIPTYRPPSRYCHIPVSYMQSGPYSGREDSQRVELISMDANWSERLSSTAAPSTRASSPGTLAARQRGVTDFVMDKDRARGDVPALSNVPRSLSYSPVKWTTSEQARDSEASWGHQSPSKLSNSEWPVERSNSSAPSRGSVGSISYA
jgi:hypothetical protein